MSGEGVLANADHASKRMAAAAERASGRVQPAATVSRAAVAAELDARAATIETARAPERVQPHSRQLPSEIEQAEAKFAARQLRIAADDIRAGLIPGETGTQEG
jgi:hypothetical protein